MGNPGDLARLPAFAGAVLQPWLWGGPASAALLEAHRLAAVQALADARKRVYQAMAPIQTKVLTAQSEAQRVAAFAELHKLQETYRAEVQAQLNAFFTPGDGLTLMSDPPRHQALFTAAWLSMVQREMLRSPSFHALMVTINADRAHPVRVTLGRKLPGVFIDGFESKQQLGDQQIDLADLARLPVDPPDGYPDAATRGEMLAHAMAEARQGALGELGDKDEYKAAHVVGIQAQNDYRDDRKQNGHRRLPPNDTSGPNAKGHFDISYDNGYIEMWVKSKEDIVEIVRY